MKKLLIAAALLGAAFPIHAQRVREVPARPRLFPSADTNSASVYYQHGVQALEQNPREAAAAFYWAERLRPGWAEALYGRRIALLVGDPRRLANYLGGNRTVLRSAEVQAIDSLQLRALMHDPLLHHRFDRTLLTRYFIEAFGQAREAYTGTRNNAADRFEVNYLLNHPQLDPALKAWFNYSDGRFPAALEEYERALRRPRAIQSRLHTDIGRIHFLAGNPAGALESLARAVAELREDDDRDLVRLYESKAVLEHTMAAVHERMGNAATAREAYGRALREDLAYYPAHARLGALAMAEGDTAGSIAEFALAVEIAPAEAVLRYQYGLVLMTAGKRPEADAELAEAMRLEPYFAGPYLIRGVLARLRGDHAQAASYLAGFLERAERDDPQRGAAEAALADARAATP